MRIILTFDHSSSFKGQSTPNTASGAKRLDLRHATRFNLRMKTPPIATALLETIWAAAQGNPSLLARLRFNNEGELPSVYAVTDLAAASMGAAGLALAQLIDAITRLNPATTSNNNGAPTTVTVDRRLASSWFGYSLRPEGWTPPSSDDFVMGDYQTTDGWIRLHTNAPHHRAAALRALKLSTSSTRTEIVAAVAGWPADALEAAVLAQNGCAATMRSWQAWQAHPQGQAVLSEPLLHWQEGAVIDTPAWAFNSARPLQGLKVLDMTRVLAGPSATRMLAGLGAEVLRVDPPWWDEPSLAPETTLGKRCTRLDLREPAQREQWIHLLGQADIFVHGYRSDALSALGLAAMQRQKIRPGLIDVSLDAYGFTGPWKHRRGFDSLVQMSMGIAEAGQRLTQANKPTPLPVQALDHATGYLLATAVLRGLETRLKTRRGSIARASLARTGALLMNTLKPGGQLDEPLAPETAADLAPTLEQTYWGPARRLHWPVEVTGVTMQWDQPAGLLGSSEATWRH